MYELFSFVDCITKEPEENNEDLRTIIRNFRTMNNFNLLLEKPVIETFTNKPQK